MLSIFLSTLSLRRATQFQHLWVPLVGFSIHALLAESDGAIGRWGTGARDFSIHALLAESDRSARMSGTPRLVFLSTLSLRRATPGNCQNSFDAAIFYPRSPCGERRESIQRCIDMMSFLSTLSLRRATVPYHERSGAQCFSIHALLAESDWWRITALWPNTPFLSTLSLRRATATNTRARHLMTFFYPRSPCGERLL